MKALENYLPFTATGSLDQQTFTNNDLGKSLTCTLTYIYGSSENLCTSTGELMEDDLNGCVLSTKAAWKLFGESSITGGILTYNEKNYYVRGVYEDTNAVVIRRRRLYLPKSLLPMPVRLSLQAAEVMQIMMQGHLPAVQEMAMLPKSRRLLVELLLNRDPN